MAVLNALTARGWAWVSTGLAGATTTAYVAVIAAEGNNTLWDVFPWVTLMLTGTSAVATAAVVRDRRVRRAFAFAGALVLAVTGSAGIFSVGAGLLLAAVAAGLATVDRQHVAT